MKSILNTFYSMMLRHHEREGDKMWIAYKTYADKAEKYRRKLK